MHDFEQFYVHIYTYENGKNFGPSDSGDAGAKGVGRSEVMVEMQ